MSTHFHIRIHSVRKNFRTYEFLMENLVQQENGNLKTLIKRQIFENHNFIIF